MVRLNLTATPQWLHLALGLFRIYREEQLHVRRRGGRKRAMGTRAPMVLPLLGVVAEL